MPAPTSGSQRSQLNGLVLMGGGARTAYQAGALQAMGQLLGGPQSKRAFPFQVLTGTSAGALNATFLASRALTGLAALDDLSQFWADIRTDAVYRLPQTPLARFSRWATALGLVLSARQKAAAIVAGKVHRFAAQILQQERHAAKGALGQAVRNRLARNAFLHLHHGV